MLHLAVIAANGVPEVIGSLKGEVLEGELAASNAHASIQVRGLKPVAQVGLGTLFRVLSRRSLSTLPVG